MRAWGGAGVGVEGVTDGSKWVAGDKGGDGDEHTRLGAGGSHPTLFPIATRLIEVISEDTEGRHCLLGQQLATLTSCLGGEGADGLMIRRVGQRQEPEVKAVSLLHSHNSPLGGPLFLLWRSSNRSEERVQSQRSASLFGCETQCMRAAPRVWP